MTSGATDTIYGVGFPIDIQVTFNQAVSVTGAPRLMLATGRAGAAAEYLSGSGTNTLTFRYTVAEGDSSPDLDYAGATALALNGGAIKDGTNAGAVLTLPEPGAPGSLSANKNLGVDGIAPTARLSARPVTTGGGTSYEFTVEYADNLAVDTDTLDDTDIRVTGPNGFDQLASLVEVTPADNGTPRTATYRISAPGGVWDSADEGTYDVAIEPDQVRDATGNTVAAGHLGGFVVFLQPDTAAPTAHLIAFPITTGGDATYEFTVEYGDNVGVDKSTIDDRDLYVQAPSGHFQFPTLVNLVLSDDDITQIATYQIDAPGGTWDVADNESTKKSGVSHQDRCYQALQGRSESSRKPLPPNSYATERECPPPGWALMRSILAPAPFVALAPACHPDACTCNYLNFAQTSGSVLPAAERVVPYRVMDRPIGRSA